MLSAFAKCLRVAGEVDHDEMFGLIEQAIVQSKEKEEKRKQKKEERRIVIQKKKQRDQLRKIVARFR